MISASTWRSSYVLLYRAHCYDDCTLRLRSRCCTCSAKCYRGVSSNRKVRSTATRTFNQLKQSQLVCGPHFEFSVWSQGGFPETPETPPAYAPVLDSNASTVSVQPLLAGTVTVESLVLRRQSLAAHTTHALRACTLQGTLLLRRHLHSVNKILQLRKTTYALSCSTN